MILFRADGNEKIGLGHIMRCLSIAEAFRTQNKKVCFVIADPKSEHIITQKGFKCIVLKSIYSDLDLELSDFCGLIDELVPEIVIIDSYFVTNDYLSNIRDKVKTVYIDDVLAFPYPVDVLINYNIFSSQEAYDELYKAVERKPRFLLGTEYVPLRREFSKCKYQEPKEKVEKIFVSTGGADPQHIGIHLLEYLIDNPDELNDYIIEFVIGSANKDIDRIKRLAEKLANVRLRIDVTDMQRLMSECDLAFSAAGSTLYELCVCCVPTITYIVANNQIPAAEAFHNKKAMINIGDIRKQPNFFLSAFSVIIDMCANQKMRAKLSKTAFELVDARGVASLTNSMLCSLTQNDNVK